MFARLLLVVILTLQNVYGQVPFFGQCPDVEAMKNFKPTKYLGKWYEVERYFAIFEFGGKCVTANYTLKDNGEIAIINQQTSAITGIDSTIEGVGNIIERSNDAKLTVQFPSLPVNFLAPYWVLNTDYDNYSIVWSCTNFGIFSTKNAWILTRQPNPKLEIIERIYKLLDSYGIDRNYFIRTDQSNCPLVN